MSGRSPSWRPLTRSDVDCKCQELSPGFIAGVTNPRFEDMEKWWDVLCNVATGTIRYASHLSLATAAEQYVTVDNDFIADVRFFWWCLNQAVRQDAKPHRIISNV